MLNSRLPVPALTLIVLLAALAFSCGDDDGDTTVTPATERTLEADETPTGVATEPRDRPRIIITKILEGDDSGQEYTFASDIPGEFSLSTGESYDSGELEPGVYFVQEEVPAGSSDPDVRCTRNSEAQDIDLARIQVEEGDLVECVVTNRKPVEGGRIVIRKETIPAEPAGNSQEFQFDTSYAGLVTVSSAQEETSAPLPASSGYSVKERVQPGWKLVSVTCSDGSPSDDISLTAGETITCTFVNEAEPERGSIVVRKETVPPGAPQEFSFTSDWLAAGFTLSDGTQQIFEELATGVYSVTEVPVARWELANASCDNGSPPDTVKVDPGEVVVCTFVNQTSPVSMKAQIKVGDGDTCVAVFRLPGGSAQPVTDLSHDPATGWLTLEWVVKAGEPKGKGSLELTCGSKPITMTVTVT